MCEKEMELSSLPSLNYWMNGFPIPQTIESNER
jgi:hypothetical protein